MWRFRSLAGWPPRCLLLMVVGGAFPAGADASNWGAFKRDHCTRLGYRQYSAILWDIPWGVRWETECANKGATIAGHSFSSPSRCVQAGGHMWGEFDVPDATCRARWGAFQADACVAIDRRQHSSRLWDVPAGVRWQDACAATPATVAGQDFPSPTRCVNKGALGMWGEFEVVDAGCRPRWGAFQRDACRSIGVRQVSSRLWDIPAGMSWPAVCAATPATVSGQFFATPTRCVDKGALGMWGEFDVADSTCPRWGDFQRGTCRGLGKRQFSSRLWDVPGGMSWEAACAATPATVEGRRFPAPTRCENKGAFGVWGEFDVDDDACAQRGGTYIVFDPPPARDIVGIAATPSGRGYWLVAADGAVYAFGDARPLGSAAGQPLGHAIVGMAATATGGGYWLAGADGAVFAFGDAPVLPSPPPPGIAAPVVGVAATPSGRGYWLVTAGGAVHPFGDARHHGALGDQPSDRPIVGISSTPSGNGYWLAAADGAVSAFGDARPYGAMTGTHLFRPVVGMARTPSGAGYTLAAADTGVFTFGDAVFRGAYGGFAPTFPVVAIANTPSGGGYWLVDSKGGVFPFGDAWVGWAATLGGRAAPRLTAGNQVQLHVDGEALFRALVRSVRQARLSVSVLQLVFDSVFTAEFSPAARLADELAAASARGVQVRIVEDWMVSGAGAGTARLARYFRDRSAPGVRVRDIALWEPQRQHAKAVIVDGREAFVLGATFQQWMWDSPNHPVDDPERRTDKGPLHTVSFSLTGPAVADVDELFVDVWNRVDRVDYGRGDPMERAVPPPAAGIQAVQILRTLPRDNAATDTAPPTGEIGILEAYQRAFANARRVIYLEHQYLTSWSIVEALRNAMDRYPDLQVIVVLNQNPDVPGYRAWQDKLIFERLGYPRPQLGVFAMWSLGRAGADGRPPIRPIYSEGKMAIIDDRWLTLGTGNLDGISLSDFETPANPNPAIPFTGLYPLFEAKRSIEINGAFFDGIEGAAGTGLAARARCALWREQLGVAEAAACAADPPPGGWLALWREVADGNVRSLSQDPPSLRGRVLPWAPGGEPAPREQLARIGVDVGRLVVRE